MSKKTIDPTERLIDGFSPSRLPVGPEGAPMPMAVAPAPRLEVINLCQLGPCKNYHELETKLDAQEPQDGSAPTVYTNITRTCYPASGIEVDVSEHQVKRCSLWEPRPDTADFLARVRRSYKTSDEGAAEWAAFEASWPKKPSDQG